jgi:hypothetical protein
MKRKNLLMLFISAVLISTGCAAASPNAAKSGDTPYTEETMTLTINGTTLTAVFADNTSAEAFKKLLKEKGSLTLSLKDYSSFEKVGPIGKTLPRNDTQITTEAGDIILYQGSMLVIYYDTNSWNFTRLGKIQNVTQPELKKILGSGDVTVTFSL